MKPTKTIPRKLALHATTLRRLGAVELAAAHGGVLSLGAPCDSVFPNFCPPNRRSQLDC